MFRSDGDCVTLRPSLGLVAVRWANRQTVRRVTAGEADCLGSDVRVDGASTGFAQTHCRGPQEAVAEGVDRTWVPCKRGAIVSVLVRFLKFIIIIVIGGSGGCCVFIIIGLFKAELFCVA